MYINHDTIVLLKEDFKDFIGCKIGKCVWGAWRGCLCYDIRSEASLQASFISLHYVNRGDTGQNSACHSGIVAGCFTHLAILPPSRAFEVLGGHVHFLMWIDLDTHSVLVFPCVAAFRTPS